MSVSASSSTAKDKGEPDSFDLSVLFGMIKRRAVLIVVIMALFLSVSLVWVLRKAPLYSSQSLIQVSQHRTALDSERDPFQNTAQIDALVAGQLRFLSSDNFLLALIRSEKINRWPEYAKVLEKIKNPVVLDYRPNDPAIPPTKAEGQLLRGLRSRLSAAREGATYIVSLTALSESPDYAARLANLAAKIYKEESLLRGTREIRQLKDRIALQLLRDREASLKDGSRVEAALQKGITYIDNNSRAKFLKRLEGIRTARARMERTLAVAIKQVQPVELDVKSIEDTSGNTNGPSDGTPALRVGPQGQEIRNNGRLIDIQDFGEKRNDILAESEKILLDMKAYLDVRHQETLYANIVDTIKTARLSTVGYSRLIKRLIELDLRARLYVSGINILTYGLVPLTPSFPKKRNTVIVSVILGSAFGLIVAILMDFFSKKIISRRQIDALKNLDAVFFLKIKAGQIPRIFGQTIGTRWHPRKIEFERFVHASKNVNEREGKNKGCAVHAFYATETNRHLGSIVRNAAGASATRGSRVAVLDLDRDGLLSEFWLKKKVRAFVRRGKPSSRPEIQRQRNLIFDIDEYFIQNIDPSFGLPVSSQTLGAIIDTIEPAYDKLFIISPFFYGSEISEVIAHHADAISIVSVYARSRISRVSDFVSWLKENSRENQQIFSVVFGAS